MDKFLTRTLGVAALLAGAGVFYNYVVHLPNLEREKMAAQEAAIEAARVRERERESKYGLCMTTARINYDTNWASACKSVAQERSRDLSNCLQTPSIISNPYMGRRWCQQQYGQIDESESCTLPGARAELVNKYYADAKSQCGVEAKM